MSKIHENRTAFLFFICPITFTVSRGCRMLTPQRNMTTPNLRHSTEDIKIFITKREPLFFWQHREFYLHPDYQGAMKREAKMSCFLFDNHVFLNLFWKGRIFLKPQRKTCPSTWDFKVSTKKTAICKCGHFKFYS